MIKEHQNLAESSLSSRQSPHSYYYAVILSVPHEAQRRKVEPHKKFDIKQFSLVDIFRPYLVPPVSLCSCGPNRSIFFSAEMISWIQWALVTKSRISIKFPCLKSRLCWNLWLCHIRFVVDSIHMKDHSLSLEEKWYNKNSFH